MNLKNKTKIKRWNFNDMHHIGRRLFEKIHKRKTAANHNHEVHFLAREINDWLPRGIQSMIEGNYTPRHLKRFYFIDEMVDQLHISDRIFQHIILKQLKPTFKHVMSKNCYHLHGPTGVKYATDRIRQILQDEKPSYVLRVDIKSFYKSIQHHKLIKDIKQHYQDPKVQVMLENIITNPIETPRGYKNPDHGLALRGPLSQFFSGIFLKKLDDAFNNMEINYLRYQDDIIIFCKTKRQLLRCKRRLMEVLHERGLSLSRKKSRIGHIKEGFHYLGIHYLPTQTEDSNHKTHANDERIALPTLVRYLSEWGGGKTTSEHQQQEAMHLVPHPRTIRKARENIKHMVNMGVSTRRIKSYLHHFILWWAKTVEPWSYVALMKSFISSCWEINPAAIAAGLIQTRFTLLDSVVSKRCPIAA